MRFNAKELILDRLGEEHTEIKKPGSTEKETVSFGEVAMGVLDGAIESDEKNMREKPEEWVRLVMRREDISSLIAEALKGEGWVSLSEKQVELLKTRLAANATRISLAILGPVLRVLEDPPPAKPNGIEKDANRLDS